MEPFARTIDAAKKYVVSSTLDRVDWNAELVRGDVGKAVQGLKAEPGKGLFVGGVKLAPAGVTVRELIELCGGMLEGHSFKAYLPGGASGGILPASSTHVRRATWTPDEATLRHGDRLNAAVVALAERLGFGSSTF